MPLSLLPEYAGSVVWHLTLLWSYLLWKPWTQGNTTFLGCFCQVFYSSNKKSNKYASQNSQFSNCKMETIMRITRRNAHSVHSRVLNMRTFFASFFSLWQKYNSQGTHEPGKMHMLIVPAQRSEVSLSYIWRTCHKPNDQPTNQIQCKEGGLQKFLVPHSYQKCGLID